MSSVAFKSVAGKVVDTTLQGMGYELVDLEFAERGLLRVYIDAQGGARSITIDDCEQVSRQLSRVFEVEGVDYARLEISSPGLDRPLTKPADYLRFAGAEIELRLREPIAGRRNFDGILSVHDDGRYAIEFDDQGNPASLDFEFDDVERAKLKPVVDFKRGIRK